MMIFSLATGRDLGTRVSGFPIHPHSKLRFSSRRLVPDSAGASRVSCATFLKVAMLIQATTRKALDMLVIHASTGMFHLPHIFPPWLRPLTSSNPGTLTLCLYALLGARKRVFYGLLALYVVSAVAWATTSPGLRILITPLP